MRGTLAHQIRQKIYMILAKLCDSFLLLGIVFGPDDLIHPPFITGSCTEHASHQMIMSVCMSKRMQGIMLVYAKFFRGNKNRSAGSQRNIAHSITNSSGSHCCRRIVSGSGCHLHCVRNSKLVCNRRKHGSHGLIGFIDLCKLILSDSADLTHLL